MLFSVHNKAVINFIRKNNKLMTSCNINNFLKDLFRIKGACRVIGIDDNNSFCPISDFFFNIVKIRIPFGLFITDIVDRFSSCQSGAGCPQRIVRRRNQDLISIVQKCGHGKIDQFADTVARIDISNRNIGNML